MWWSKNYLSFFSNKQLIQIKKQHIFGEFKNLWLFFFIGDLIKDRSSHLKVVDSFLSWLEIAPYNLNSRIIFTLFSSQWQSNIMAKLALQLLTTLSPHTQWGQILSEVKFALSYITFTISQDNFTLSHLYQTSGRCKNIWFAYIILCHIHKGFCHLTFSLH